MNDENPLASKAPLSLTDGASGSILGMTAMVKFATFGNRGIQGKVDTGATTSSLHAADIKVDQQRGTVTFRCPELSNNKITLDLDGSQEVHSADAGGQSRPVVTLDVEIDGTPIKNASFNLNDRSGMDIPVLIGQNILKSGNFMVDPKKDGVSEVPDHDDTMQQTREGVIMQAVELLAENDVTLSEIISYLQTSAINRIKE